MGRSMDSGHLAAPSRLLTEPSLLCLRYCSFCSCVFLICPFDGTKRTVPLRTVPPAPEVWGLPFSVKWETLLGGHQRGVERATSRFQAPSLARGDCMEVEDPEVDSFTPFCASARPGKLSAPTPTATVISVPGLRTAKRDDRQSWHSRIPAGVRAPPKPPTLQSPPLVHPGQCPGQREVLTPPPWSWRAARRVTPKYNWRSSGHVTPKFPALEHWFKKCIVIYLAALGLSCSMWDLSSLTRDRTWAPCTGNTESWPLEHQERPWHMDYLELLALEKQQTQEKAFFELPLLV